MRALRSRISGVAFRRTEFRPQAKTQNMKTPEIPPPLLRRAARLPALLLRLAAFALPAVAQVDPILIDNTSPSGFEPWGSFHAATTPSGYIYSNYFHDNGENKGNRAASYRPDILTAGNYEVAVRWPQSGTHATSVPVDIISQAGTTTVHVNQSISGGTWNTVGVFPFAVGTSGYVRIRNAGTTGRVIWDAVRFTHVPDEEEIVDNPDATTTGSWTLNDTGYPLLRYGNNYLTDGGVKSSLKTATFTPTLPSEGVYDVYIWWTSHANRSTNTPVFVYSAEGVEKFLIDQTLGGGGWHHLGTYNMLAGTYAKVVISNEGTADGTHVIADAVRFVKRHSVERIVDNTDPSSAIRTGSWSTSDAMSGHYGTNFLHDKNDGKGAKSVKFIPDLPHSDTYEVFVRWPNNDNNYPRATNTRIIVDWSGGVTEHIVNQKQNGGSWVSLGVYPFVHGRVGSVTVSNKDTNGYVLADAVRFVRKTKLWTPEDLGDRLWSYWTADSLPDGPVVSWYDSRRNVELYQRSLDPDNEDDSPYVPLRPEKTSAGEVFFANMNKHLHIPFQPDAIMSHRAILALFRGDVSGSAKGQTFFAINGTNTNNINRQPALSINPKDDRVAVTWMSRSGSNGIGFDIPNDKTKWHAVVSRRTRDHHFASINGRMDHSETGAYGENSVPMADWGLYRDPLTSPQGRVGTPSNHIEFALDTIAIVSGDVTRAEAERLTGWAMWKRGQQHRLPDDHPFRHHPPYVPIPHYHFVESTPGEWNELVARFGNMSGNADSIRSNLGDAVDLSDWNEVFRDDFDQHSVTDDTRGRGLWFAPGHPEATGVARAVVPGFNASTPTIGSPGSPSTYVHTGSSMKIIMRRHSGTYNWTSGSFASVNSNGFGRAWLYPYVEARIRVNGTNADNLNGVWPALWLKSLNFFHNRAETNLEYDIFESYGSDQQDNYHHAIHNWVARAKQPGRVQQTRRLSHIKSLGEPWDPDIKELFDGEYHTYATMVTPEWTITYFDGKEVGRHKTPIEMHQPLWILVDLAMKEGNNEHKAAGWENHEIEIDYISVRQNPAHEGYNQFMFP